MFLHFQTRSGTGYLWASDRCATPRPIWKAAESCDWSRVVQRTLVSFRSVSRQQKWKPKPTRGARENETDGAVRLPALLWSRGSGPPRPPRPPRSPHPPGSPGCSPLRTPLRPSWPQLLSPHERTVLSLNSRSEWRSPLAACRSSAPAVQRLCGSREPARQHQCITRLPPEVCPPEVCPRRPVVPKTARRALCPAIMSRTRTSCVVQRPLHSPCFQLASPSSSPAPTSS